MEFPHRGAPAPRFRWINAAVLTGDEVLVVSHELAEHLHLLSQNCFYCSYRPFLMKGVAIVWRHFDDHGLVLFSRSDGRATAELCCDGGVEANENMVVDVLEVRRIFGKLAVAAFCAFRLDSVEKSDCAIDTAFANISELGGEVSMVLLSEPERLELRLKLVELVEGGNDLFRLHGSRRQGSPLNLVLEFVEIRIV